MLPIDPAIDFTQIEFPSDRLTIKDLRKAIPNSFDLAARLDYSRINQQGFFKRESLESYLGGILNTEREIAALAFYEALGRPLPELIGPRWSAVEALSHDYAVVRLTRGEHESQELVRHIEAQAAAQAKRYLGITPNR